MYGCLELVNLFLVAQQKVRTKPNKTKLTEPNLTKPDQRQPNQTNVSQTKPNQTKQTKQYSIEPDKTELQKHIYPNKTKMKQ